MKATTTREQSAITKVNQLKPLLSDHFIILFGSAVSGVMSPKLPMINDVTHIFLQQASLRLYEGSYRDKVIAGYAQDMVNGYHKALVSQTKFENFIYELQSALGKEAVDDLFVRIFSCQDEQYNHNHSALAFLLQNRICLAALTTNFDNQVELCLPNITTYIYPDRPTNLPTVEDHPVLVKLHGDAPTRTYIATSPQLSQARSLATYAFIEELLRNQIVLTLGYSGTGDIDIAPHLGKYEKLLIWGDYAINESRPKAANQIDLLCDLSLTHPGIEKKCRRNLLLELAESYGWEPSVRSTPLGKMDWEDKIVDWTRQIPTEYLRQFITSFMSWRTSWPHVHIAYLGLKEDNSYKNRVEYAVSTVQVAAYISSEKLLKSLQLTEAPSLRLYLSVAELLGFTHWGKRHYEQALSTYLTILQDHELLIAKRNTTPTEVQDLVSGTAREYLETLIEVANNERENDKRREIVQNSRASYVAQILYKSDTYTSSYLNKIALLEVRHWLGTPVPLVEAQDLFDQCIAMQEWASAALTAQFMLTLSFAEGNKAATEIISHLKKRRSTKLITKIHARIIYERLHRIIPVQILNFKAFTDLLLLGVEIIFAFKRMIWKLDCRANRVRIETGFLRLGTIWNRK